MPNCKTIRQAWREARQNPVFSGIYVGGVALAIASTMLFALVQYIRLAPIYPEYNRGRTLYIMSAQCSIKLDFGDGNVQTHNIGYSIGYPLIADYLSQLENCEEFSACKGGLGEGLVLPEGGKEKSNIHIKEIDPAFFRIYDFKILAGRLITQQDFDSHSKIAVVGDKLARKWWGGEEEAVGKTFELDDNQYTVVGVVKQPSFLVNPGYTVLSSYAQAYLPYTHDDQFDTDPVDEAPFLGPYSVQFLVKDDDQAEALKTEVEEMLHRINSMDTTNQISFYDSQPYGHFEAVMKEYSSDEFDSWSVIKKYGVIFLALLFVPALNLSGMIAGKMDGKLPEIGIRKSFGASRRKLLGQILIDNLVLTGIGAVLGLIIAFVVFYACRGSIAYLFFNDAPEALAGEEVQITADMLFNPTVFFGALGVCLVLNLLAAIIPAMVSLKRPIVSSINQKR
ncbi:MAG: ABC transporter permease [Bacteroidales bacterium]|nr:ABC transporter permease [Bacteroidales bacterium]